MVNPEQTHPKGCGSVRAVARAHPLSSLLANLCRFQPPSRTCYKRPGEINPKTHYLFRYIISRSSAVARVASENLSPIPRRRRAANSTSRCVHESYWFLSRADGGGSSSTLAVVVRWWSTPVAKVNGDVRFTYFRHHCDFDLALRCVSMPLHAWVAKGWQARDC